MAKNKKHQTGQSLLEMVFAIGILLLVVAAILALTTSGVIGQKESESQIIANNLAREGIEAVRNIRDSNWLAGDNWDKGLVDQTYNTAIALFSPNSSWQLSFISADMISGQDLLYISSDGYYGHQATPQPSPFSRYLILDSICQQTDGGQSIKTACGAAEQKIGLKITANVNWVERGRKRLVNLEDLIYEWK
jgi:type II secretory pathway pseudopilin PulG